jgi:CheY-like chemotaxis protein
MGTRIVIGEDHPMIRRGLISLLRTTDDLHVVTEAATPEGLRAAVREHDPDLVILPIRFGNRDRAPNAWFNLGTLYQQRGSPEDAIAAFREAVASQHPEFAPKAAVNLGFVLYNDLGDLSGATAAFETAITSGHPQQTPLAIANLRAMQQLALEVPGRTAVDDRSDVSVGHGKGGLKLRFWSRRPSKD